MYIETLARRTLRNAGIGAVVGVILGFVPLVVLIALARSLDSLPLIEVASESETDVDDLSSAGAQTVPVDTPIGAFEAAYMPWQWRGPEYPTLIYHHGGSERPIDFGRFSSNSFRRLFVATDEPIPATVVAVGAPFHDGSNMDYARAMGELENFVGMLAASAALIDALATQASDQTSSPVLASGTSLGGWAVNLHRACFDTVDRYAPIFAGAALGEMFVSSIYRKMTVGAAQRRPGDVEQEVAEDCLYRSVCREPVRFPVGVTSPTSDRGVHV